MILMSVITTSQLNPWLGLGGYLPRAVMPCSNMLQSIWSAKDGNPSLLCFLIGGNRVSAFPSTEIPQRCNPCFHTQAWHVFDESKNGIHADSDFQNNEEVVF